MSSQCDAVLEKHCRHWINLGAVQYLSPLPSPKGESHLVFVSHPTVFAAKRYVQNWPYNVFVLSPLLTVPIPTTDPCSRSSATIHRLSSPLRHWRPITTLQYATLTGREADSVCRQKSQVCSPPLLQPFVHGPFQCSSTPVQKTFLAIQGSPPHSISNRLMD